MPALNLVLQGKEIKTFLRRCTFDFSQLQEGESVSDAGVVCDAYNNYIYCLTADDMTTMIAWIDGKEYDHGDAEDLTHASEINDWLVSEQAKGRVGVESKSDIYDKLKVQFPEQECIDARS